jgi:acetyltransferase
MNGRSAFEALFSPVSVAVIGASDRPGTVGRTVTANLCAGRFKGRVYPVNPKHDTLFGRKCYPSISAISDTVDLAVIATPAITVPTIIGECVSAGVRSAVVISAGFRESGPQGMALERQIQEALRHGALRLVGPNCLGVMNPELGMNATFAHDLALPGSVAFISQSGALLTAILDWSLQESVGFSAIVSCGSMLDLGWGDLIQFFGDDPATQSILLYMESVGDARSFLSSVREVALRKPVIIIKAGRSEAAAKAATSHTGALASSDPVFDAAIRRCGALRVRAIADLFYMAEVLGRQSRPRGPRLAIVSNAGGPAVLATDELLAQGGELAQLSSETLANLDGFLPPHWSKANPIDILGDAPPERYARTLEIASRDPNIDGLLVVLAPQGMTDPQRVAQALTPYAKLPGKPILAAWMGGKVVAPAIATLNAAGIPTFSYSDTAARAFDYMWRYTYNLRALYETPELAPGTEPFAGARRAADLIVQTVRSQNRSLLTEVESKQLLACYGIPVVETRIAYSAEDAAAQAAAIGFPVVVKVYSHTIVHKTDVGGVKLNLLDAAAVQDAYAQIEAAVAQKAGMNSFEGVTVEPMVSLEGYELILGSTVDPQFGPVILFGAGGQLVEVLADRALALPPLNMTLAQRLIEQTRIYKALGGVRGRAPIDLTSLKRILVQLSILLVEQPRIREIDINPLLAAPERIVALDARIILHDSHLSDAELPRTAIRPYPAQYSAPWAMRDGREVLIRPIRPEDEPAMVQFHGTLSDATVYLRYFHMENFSTRVAHERLLRKCFIDYDREIALVATVSGDGNRIVAVGRLSKVAGGSEGEVAVLVADAFQGEGLGTELLRRLIEVARDEKLRSVTANILPQNVAMRALAKRFQFHEEQNRDFSEVHAVLELS